MKSRVIPFVIVVLLAATPLVLVQPPAQAATADQLAQNCSIAQKYLSNIQKPRDLRARVDRLQAYRYIARRMDVFISRLERNNQPQASQLRASNDQLNTQISHFKDDYELYDAARDQVSGQKDCANDTAKFQERLDLARARRQQVNDDTSAIQNILNPGVSGQLSTLYSSLLETGKTGGALNE